MCASVQTWNWKLMVKNPKMSQEYSLLLLGYVKDFFVLCTDLNGDMNVNGITAADGGSQSGPDPPASSYHHHHQQAIMEYDYLWIPSHYNSDMGSGSGCGTGHGTDQKQQQPPHAFQGHYPINRTMGSSQQPPVTREQYWGQGCPGQQQGGSSATIPYSHSMYGVYPNQVLNHQQQQQHFGMVPNGVPCYQSQHTLLSSEQSGPLTPLMPTAQMFTPLRGSSQHHHMGHASTDSSIPMQASMRSPNAKNDNGSPKRKKSPGRGTVVHSSGIQGEYYLQSTSSKNIWYCDDFFSYFLVQSCTLCCHTLNDANLLAL